jgi:hypothetical protein
MKDRGTTTPTDTARCGAHALEINAALVAAREHCRDTGHRIFLMMDAGRVCASIEEQGGYTVVSAHEGELYGDAPAEFLDTLTRLLNGRP